MLELKPTRPAARPRGFTLVELLVAVAIVAIFATIAVPSFQGLMASSRTTSVANELLGGLQQTRSEAVRYSSNADFCPRASDNTCGSDFSNGWVVRADQDRNGTPETTVRVRDNMPSGVTVTSTLGLASPRLTFRALGQAHAATTFTVTHSNPSVTRFVCIYAGGQTQVKTERC